MMLGFRLIAVLLLFGWAWSTRADPGEDWAQKRKSAKPGINVVRQKDGSIIERLDALALPGAVRDERVPVTPEEWLSRMIDPTRNGLILKHPKLFAEWLNAVTEPRFMTALATVALDPSSYPRTLNHMLDPAAARNWAEFIDPEIFMRWVAAGMDPELYQAVFQHMFNPDKYLRWAAYPGNPRGEAIASRETSQNALVARARSGDDASPSRSWLQLPARKPGANPWLLNSNTYRY